MRTIIQRAVLVLGLILAWSVSAQAQEFHPRFVVIPRGPIYAPYFYNPFWGAHYPYVGYPYAAPYFGHPYATYRDGWRPMSDVKVQVTPKDADIYVDGYDAGPARNFEGILKRLHATPGGHEITMHLEGYRTVTEHVYLPPGSTYTLRESMVKLPPGEASAPVPAPPHKG